MAEQEIQKLNRELEQVNDRTDQLKNQQGIISEAHLKAALHEKKFF